MPGSSLVGVRKLVRKTWLMKENHVTSRETMLFPGKPGYFMRKPGYFEKIQVIFRNILVIGQCGFRVRTPNYLCNRWSRKNDVVSEEPCYSPITRFFGNTRSFPVAVLRKSNKNILWKWGKRGYSEKTSCSEKTMFLK